MRTTDSDAAESMNWADSWDSLSEEYFLLRASTQAEPAMPVERMPERAAFVETLHEIARDLT